MYVDGVVGRVVPEMYGITFVLKSSPLTRSFLRKLRQYFIYLISIPKPTSLGTHILFVLRTRRQLRMNGASKPPKPSMGASKVSYTPKPTSGL